MRIKPPSRSADHPDRFLDVQEAIEDAVLRVLEDAVAAGWGQAESIAAIVTVAENKMLAITEDAYLDDLLKRLRKQ